MSFSSMGEYMSEKRRKTHEQLHARFEGDFQDERKVSLFDGVCVYVNGRTDPPMSMLRQLVLAHGGRVENVDIPSKVTHIVAENLCMAKLKALRTSTRPMVKAKWLVDCIEAGTLLPTAPYSLYPERDQLGSTTITSLFGDSSTRTSAGTGTSTAAQMIGITRTSISEPDTHPSDANLRPHAAHIPLHGGNDQSGLYRSEPAMPLRESESEMNATPSKVTPSFVTPSAAPNPVRPTALERQPTSSRPSSGGPRNSLQQHDPRPHRTMRSTDPTFVESYFSNSRLHFIGSWTAHLEDFVTTLELEKDTPMYGPSVAQPQELRAAVSNVRLGHRWVVHIDMDCFFASVYIRDHPELEGKPVAVSHSSGNGAEISSCNYEARKYGVGAGMWMKGAREMCPDLIVVPYLFEDYTSVSETLYRTFFKYTHVVQAVSCDEAFLQLPASMSPETAKQVVNEMRHEIKTKTGCDASAGISRNILLARLATSKAKPNGCCVVTESEAASLIGPKEVRKLPGVGRKISNRLADMNITTCEHLSSMPVSRLQEEFGPNNGQLLWNHAQGLDERPLQLISEKRGRTSIGAEINWAIRFQNREEVVVFLGRLTDEVCRRLSNARHPRGSGYVAKGMTLKLKERRAGEPIEPIKYLGMGRCNSHNRSCTFPYPTCDPAVISAAAVKMYDSVTFPHSDLRGVGIAMSRLTPACDLKPRNQNTLLQSFSKVPAPSKTKNVSGSRILQHPTRDEESVQILQNEPETKISMTEAEAEPIVAAPSGTVQLSWDVNNLPPLHELDQAVVRALPLQMRKELAALYKMALKRKAPSKPQGTDISSMFAKSKSASSHSARSSSPTAASSSGADMHTPAKQVRLNSASIGDTVSPSQWDESIINEVGGDLGRELRLMKMRHHNKQKRNRNKMDFYLTKNGGGTAAASSSSSSSSFSVSRRVQKHHQGRKRGGNPLNEKVNAVAPGQKEDEVHESDESNFELLCGIANNPVGDALSLFMGMRTHLSALLSRHRYDLVFQRLTTLRRLIGQRAPPGDSTPCIWQRAFNRLLDHAQSGMRSYLKGGQLAVPRFPLLRM